MENKVIEIKIGDYTNETKKISLKELKASLNKVPKHQRYFYLDNLFNNKKITEAEYDWLLG